MGEFTTKKFLDEAGLKKFWELNKQYIEEYINAAGENINLAGSLDDKGVLTISTVFDNINNSNTNNMTAGDIV